MADSYVYIEAFLPELNVWVPARLDRKEGRLVALDLPAAPDDRDDYEDYVEDMADAVPPALMDLAILPRDHLMSGQIAGMLDSPPSPKDLSDPIRAIAGNAWELTAYRLSDLQKLSPRYTFSGQASSGIALIDHFTIQGGRQCLRRLDIERLPDGKYEYSAECDLRGNAHYRQFVELVETLDAVTPPDKRNRVRLLVLRAE